MTRSDLFGAASVPFVLLLPLTMLSHVWAKPVYGLPGCTSPVPGLVSCTYTLVRFEGKVLPYLLKNTHPYEKRVMKLTGGLLRLNTTTQGLKTGEGDYSLQWDWQDIANPHRNSANDVGSYTLDGAGHLVLTSLGKTMYRGTLNGGHVKFQQVPLVTETFSGRVALDFAAP